MDFDDDEDDQNIRQMDNNVPRASMSHIQNEMENREMHDKYRGVQRVESMIDEEIEREDEFSSFN
jgi:hypothetical protein